MRPKASPLADHEAFDEEGDDEEGDKEGEEERSRRRSRTRTTLWPTRAAVRLARRRRRRRTPVEIVADGVAFRVTRPIGGGTTPTKPPPEEEDARALHALRHTEEDDESRELADARSTPRPTPSRGEVVGSRELTARLLQAVDRRRERRGRRRWNR